MCQPIDTINRCTVEWDVSDHSLCIYIHMYECYVYTCIFMPTNIMGNSFTAIHITYVHYMHTYIYICLHSHM